MSKLELVESVTKDRQPKIDIKPSIDSKQADEQSDLEKYCVNLNERADTDAIDCLIGRQAEIQRTIEILCRRKKIMLF